MSGRPPSIARGGFTNVDLLVVVAILMILISLLLPVLHTARLRALNMVCTSNLHQLVPREWRVKLGQDQYGFHAKISRAIPP